LDFGIGNWEICVEAKFPVYLKHSAFYMNNQAVIEIFTINLRPGMRDAFHQLFTTRSLPLQKKWKIDVVAHGPSLHDENSYYVIRKFLNLEHRQQSLDDFYNSDDWQKGPRTEILALIESYNTAVVPLQMLINLNS
jgi:hypothetical protein